MNKREAGDYLEDILNSMLAIQEFTDGYSYGSFAADMKTQYAVIRAIEIIVRHQRMCLPHTGELIPKYHGEKWQP
ncbi:hypothetical protein SAMN04488589_2855 [Methanolobus vulcani]|jgi:uncharacterized protein with HEPN domain|uniref:HEPN domain-containing protein n=1 Tax=Methanolobus vulcani TaxID=38026 RepID=A0A7Z7B249_9EURY|nr:hypothetical protein [Methanolobus vulcani]MDK2948801.1 hypothetical protein [Methanolobus sp.]SDG38112.1 hypothetical protein SAMN04488589_2855 [Methanolobus vulcani]